MLGKIKRDLQQNLFKTRLTDLINLGHPLGKLADEVSWEKWSWSLLRLFAIARVKIYIQSKEDLLFLLEKLQH